MEKIVVLDVGGNIFSVVKALNKVKEPDQEVIVSNDCHIADRIVFPGQGSIGTVMSNIAQEGIRDSLIEALKEKPVLGICVGMQALMDYSDEDGGVECLGVIPGCVQHLSTLKGRTVENTPLSYPHMGWNVVYPTDSFHLVTALIGSDDRFYFAHSYCCIPDSVYHVIARTRYKDLFPSIIAKYNVIGVQFHPEKSLDAGLRLLSNFCKWDP